MKHLSRIPQCKTTYKDVAGTQVVMIIRIHQTRRGKTGKRKSKNRLKTDKLNKKKQTQQRERDRREEMRHDTHTWGWNLQNKTGNNWAKTPNLMKHSSKLPEAKSDVLKYLVMCDHQSETQFNKTSVKITELLSLLCRSCEWTAALTWQPSGQSD